MTWTGAAVLCALSLLGFSTLLIIGGDRRHETRLVLAIVATVFLEILCWLMQATQPG